MITILRILVAYLLEQRNWPYTELLAQLYIVDGLEIQHNRTLTASMLHIRRKRNLYSSVTTYGDLVKVVQVVQIIDFVLPDELIALTNPEVFVHANHPGAPEPSSRS